MLTIEKQRRISRVLAYVSDNPRLFARCDLEFACRWAARLHRPSETAGFSDVEMASIDRLEAEINLPGGHPHRRYRWVRPSNYRAKGGCVMSKRKANKLFRVHATANSILVIARHEKGARTVARMEGYEVNPSTKVAEADWADRASAINYTDTGDQKEQAA